MKSLAACSPTWSSTGCERCKCPIYPLGVAVMNMIEWESFESADLRMHYPVDIVALRMEVRQMARRAGLGLVGQSSLSLATSNLAYKIGLDSRPGGQVTMNWQQLGTRVGVRLVITIPIRPEEDFLVDLSEDVTLLVDRVEIHTQPENMLVISMVKWGESAPVHVQ